jgi:hypothetical protein
MSVAPAAVEPATKKSMPHRPAPTSSDLKNIGL